MYYCLNDFHTHAREQFFFNNHLFLLIKFFFDSLIYVFNALWLFFYLSPTPSISSLP